MAGTVVIWGAGKIGRGFLAEIFTLAGFQLVFVVRSPTLLQRLVDAGEYEIVRSAPDGQRQTTVIRGYSVILSSDASAVTQAINNADLVAMPVYPKDFGQIAEQLAPALVQRSHARPDDPLDIIVGTNLVDGVMEFRRHLMAVTPPAYHAYLHSKVGLVEALLLCTVTDPPPDEQAAHPLRMWASGYSGFPVDRAAFRGPIPTVPGLRLIDNAQAEKTRKIFMNNMAHATLAYLGARKGYRLIVEAVSDPAIRSHLIGALRETSQALQLAFGFPKDEMDQMIQYILVRYDNPELKDNIYRVAADPVRKLGRNDRLVGPALLARKHGIWPSHIIESIAAALLYSDPQDPSATYLQAEIDRVGVEATVRALGGFTAAEDDLVQAIVRAYTSMLAADGPPLHGLAH